MEVLDKERVYVDYMLKEAKWGKGGDKVHQLEVNQQSTLLAKQNVFCFKIFSPKRLKMPSKDNATRPTHGTNKENLFALKHVVPIKFQR